MTAKKSTHAKKDDEKADHGAAPAAPWDRENPKGDQHQHLGPKEKAEARARAKKAGRPYPNLVDNMAVARAAKK